MHKATIFINPTMFDSIGFTTAAGLPGDIRFYFKTPTNLAYSGDAQISIRSSCCDRHQLCRGLRLRHRGRRRYRGLGARSQLIASAGFSRAFRSSSVVCMTERITPSELIHLRMPALTKAGISRA